MDRSKVRGHCSRRARPARRPPVAAERRIAGPEPADRARRRPRARPSTSWPGRATSRTGRPTRTTTGSRDFEKETGCNVEPQIFGTSDEAFTLFSTNPEQFDVISASGDASLRLVRGGFVQPVNVDLFKNYPDIFQALKNKPYNTVDGVHYGVPHGRGSNLLMWRTDQVTPAPTTWAQMFDPGQRLARSSVYDAPIYIADAAVVLMKTKPELGIKNPYALDDTQFEAAVDLLKQQKPADHPVLGRLPQADGRFRTGDANVGTTWQIITNLLQGEDPAVPVEVIKPPEGRHGLVGHLDDQLQDQEPRLRLRVHRPPRLARDERADRRVVRRGAGQLEVVRPDRRPGPLRRSSTPTTTPSGRTSGTGRPRRPSASTAAPT